MSRYASYRVVPTASCKMLRRGATIRQASMLRALSSNQLRYANSLAPCQKIYEPDPGTSLGASYVFILHAAKRAISSCLHCCRAPFERVTKVTNISNFYMLNSIDTKGTVTLATSGARKPSWEIARAKRESEYDDS